MRKSDFPIPIKEIATKAYVDDRVGSDVKLHIGIVREEIRNEFKIIREGQQGLVEHLERFELETGQRFKFFQNRLDNIVLEITGFQTETRTNFDLVLSEIREIKEKI